MTQKFITKGFIALAVLGSTTLYATNGDTLIGVGVKSRGMGGAGIAYGQGAESALLNPALITNIEGNEFSFGATIFMPTIETDIGPTGTTTKSKADISMIPEVSLAHNLGNGVYLGYGMWGTAGMGVDFKNKPGLFKMNTQLQLMQIAVPVAYKTGGLSIAIAPIVQYGSLDIAYDQTPGAGKVGSGVSSDFGYGVNLGATYDFDNGFVLGLVYKSAIEMEYEDQIKPAAAPFGLMMSDILEQPAEYGIGVAYTSNGHTFAIDYKRIAWSDATGYKDFKWEDQDIIAVGYQYAQDNWAVRLGYNHGSSPVTEQMNPAINAFNLLGFPATAEDHYTAGASYAISNTTAIDLAVVYSPESKKTFTLNPMFPGAKILNQHSETSISIQVTHKF